MTEAEKRAAIVKYFKPFPTWAIWFILGGLALAVLGSSVSTLLLIGIAAIAIGALGIYLGVGAKATDQQMDQFLQEDFISVTKQMLKKIGMDETELVAESQHVYGPGFGTGTEAAKKGKDGKVRYTPIKLASIGFGANQLLYYSCLLDMTTGKMLNEATDEFFYKDVVSASTKMQSASFKWKGQQHQFNEAETFTLTTAGGTSFSVFLRDPQLASVMGVSGGDIPTGDAEKAIQAIRKMLREKKA